MEENKFVGDARVFAVKYHGQQKYGEKPYVYHLDQVHEIAKPYGPVCRAVAYLHDVIEDTKIDFEDVVNAFGPNVGLHVLAITDPPAGSRKEQKKRLYKILKSFKDSVVPADHVCLIVKAADRLANVRATIAEGRHDLLQMYRSEQSDLMGAIYRPGLCDPIFDELIHIIKE